MADTNFSQFTLETAPALTDYVVGYRTAVSGGERRTLHSALQTLYLQNYSGATSIVTVGTITAGTWQGTAVANGFIATALTGKTYNGLSLTAEAVGFSVAGGTTSKTLTVSNTLTFTGTDGSSVNFGAGGTVLYSGGSYVSSITGTANQVIASGATGAVTLSTPQDIATTSSPTFANPIVTSLVFGATTPGIISGSSGALTLTAAGTNQNITIEPSGTGETRLGAGGASLSRTGYTGSTVNSYRIRNTAGTDSLALGLTGTSATSGTSWINGVDNLGFIYVPGAAGTQQFRLGIGTGATSYFGFNGTTLNVAPTTEATTGGAGSITTAGGIYATKKIISATDITALGVFEIGNASDTTLSRVSAGVAAIEGVNILTSNASGVQTALSNAVNVTGGVVTVDGTATLTNKTLTAPTLTGTTTITGGGGATIDNSSASVGTISSTGGGGFDITANIQLNGNVLDTAGGAGSSGQVLKSNGSGQLTYGNDLGSYTLSFIAGSLTTVVDATTYYLGAVSGVALGTNQGRFAVYVPKTGTIKAVEINSYASTAGSNESWTWSVAVNNGTPTTVQAVAASTNNRRWTNTALSVAVTAGDYIEVLTTTPTWGTNPATLNVAATVYIETAL